jgi:hypothetical protein
LAFKTGFSARALIGLLGNDDFSFKVSPDGSAFFDASRIDRTSGQVELPQPRSCQVWPQRHRRRPQARPPSMRATAPGRRGST